MVDLKNTNNNRFSRTHCASVDSTADPTAEPSADDAPNMGGLTPIQRADEMMRNSMTFYDIKGNSFKNTLVPKATANSALRMMSSTQNSLLQAQNIYSQENSVLKIKK